MRIPTRLLAVVTAGIALSTVVSAASQVVVQPAAAQSSAAPNGRVLFAGTQHRSLGVVATVGSSASASVSAVSVASDSGLSAPLFGSAPTHFDDQPSAVGGLLVFTSLRNASFPQVYLRDAAGNVRQLTTGLDAADPRLSPDGTEVAFDAAPVGPGGVGAQRHLWLVDTDGTGLRQLTDSTGNDIDPTFSPDGTEIAYSCDATGTSQIYRIPLAGGPSVRLTTAGPATQPAWNPVNAGEIAYSEDLGSGRRLRMISGGTPGLQVLPGGADDVQSFSPTWKPDGTTLTFVSLVDNVNQVFEVDVAPCGCLPVATPPQLLLDEDRGDDSPTWLNGQLVVARSTPPDQITADVQDVEPDGTDPRDLGLSMLREDPGAATDSNLLFNPHPGFDPWLERQDYSPDGRRMAVSRFETVNGQRIERIWLANADGSDATPMPLADRKPGDWETDATWSPDGNLIAFTRQSPGGPQGGPTRVVIANVATGQVVATVPGQDPTLNDAQPTWSPDGNTLAFTRVADIGGSLANKHIWITSLSAPNVQRDLTAQVCAAQCPVIDDSPAFSPDGSTVAFNRKDDAVLLVAADGSGCRVLLPAGQNSCAGPITAPNGPFQPRDVAYSPDGTQLMLTTRRCACQASPETLAVVDVATGRLTEIDSALPGRQKEPSWQQTVDLAVSAPSTTPAIPVDGGQTVPVTVTDHGPAPAPGTTLSVTVPPGLRVEGLDPTAAPAT